MTLHMRHSNNASGLKTRSISTEWINTKFHSCHTPTLCECVRMCVRESRCTCMCLLPVFESWVNWGRLSVTGGDMSSSAQQADTQPASWHGLSVSLLYAPPVMLTLSIVYQLSDIEGRQPCVIPLSYLGICPTSMCLISHDYTWFWPRLHCMLAKKILADFFFFALQFVSLKLIKLAHTHTWG